VIVMAVVETEKPEPFVPRIFMLAPKQADWLKAKSRAGNKSMSALMREAVELLRKAKG
jgi:hypothetical protein